MMRRALSGYSIYVFDVDGTLYDQPKLRTIMAIRLMMHYLLHPFSAKELFALSHFRKVKDGWTENSSEDDIIKKTAEDMNMPADKVKSTVRKWIYDEPLLVISRTKDTKLITWMNKLRADGKKVVTLSDYPSEDKLEALGVTADRQYSPDDERIDELKPSPKGLKVIMEDYSADPAEVLMIGDRMEKDGKCAEGASVDFLILERKVSRRKSYEE